MARVSYGVRNTVGALKYDAPPNLVNYTDESRPDLTFNLTNFFKIEIGHADNTIPGRDRNGDNNGCIPSQPPLSARANSNQLCDEDSIRNIGANLFSLLNPGEAKRSDQKTTDECDPSGHKGYGKSISPSPVRRNDISIPDYLIVGEKPNTPKEPKGRKCITSNESDFNFSDILSSIRIDDDQPNSRLSESSVQSGDQSLCLDDFNVVGEKSKQLAGLSVQKDFRIDIAPYNSSTDFSDAEFNATALQENLPGCEILDNDAEITRSCRTSSSEDSGIGSSIESLSSKQTSLNSIDIQDLIEDATARNENNFGTSFDSNKSVAFSFFSDSTQNQLTFSQLLDDNRNTDVVQQSDSSCEEDGIRLFDLLSSVRSSKDGMSVSESNSFTSDEIEKEGDSTSISSPDEKAIAAIDLSTCIKSFEDKSFILSSEVTKIDARNPKHRNTPETLYNTSLPLRKTASPQARRKNLKQSLFAKALSCKTKKDPSLVHKVAHIKAELFGKVFAHPVPVTRKVFSPQIEVAIYSDKPITQCNCRRVFGQIESGVSPVR